MIQDYSDALEELKHSIRLHLAFANQPTDAMGSALVKMMDYLSGDQDDLIAGMRFLSGWLIHTLCIATCKNLSDEPDKLMLGMTIDTPKEQLLSLLAIRLRELAKETDTPPIEIRDRRGNVL